MQNIDEGFGGGDSTPDKINIMSESRAEQVWYWFHNRTSLYDHCCQWNTTYTHRDIHTIYAQGILYFSFLNLVGLASLSHTCVFPGWLLQGLKPFSQGHPVSKVRGWMRSPSSLGLLPGAPRWQPGSPHQAHFAPLVPGQGGVYFPGRKILSQAPKEQNEMTPGRIWSRDFSCLVDLGVSLQSQRLNG